MLILNDVGLENKENWVSAGFLMPKFDRSGVISLTEATPEWVHFGAGNIFRAFIADISQSLLNQGLSKTGIIVAEGYDTEIIDTVYTPYDNLCINVILKSDGDIEKRVLASVTESLKTDTKGLTRLMTIFESESLQIVSLTITEKGYSVKNAEDSFYESVNNDMLAGPDAATTFIGKLTALCYHRFIKGAQPLALVSMDNVSNNGKCLQDAIRLFAESWAKFGYVKKSFLEYIDNPEKLSFPWTMIDKITPGPSKQVAEHLKESGLALPSIIVTEKTSEVAPFVNAEETGYLVIEDSFPNGRPALEKAGVILTNRETVTKVEKMKVCTCLNPLHTALSVFACMLGFTRVSDSMKDEDIAKLIRFIASEGMPVVVDPKILSPKEFADTVINIRLPNSFIPDTPQRIATDTSQKLSVRFGETIKAYVSSDTLDVTSLKAIPLALAGWCRYLVGIDDTGKGFKLDPDPLLPELRPVFSVFSLGNDADYKTALRPILSNSSIFGLDLYTTGIAEKIESLFAEMMKEPGAVRKALQKL